MTETQKNKQFDLEDRTYKFAKDCRNFVKKLPKIASSFEYGKQLIRSSGSQAANYIEANEAVTKKDFLYRIRISRKEKKESCLWLKLCEPIQEQTKEQQRLLQEATELRKIFNAILEKSK